LAIFFGTLLGLVVAFGIWKASSTIEKVRKSPEPTTASNTSTNNEESNKEIPKTLAILSPEENAVIIDPETNIQGITAPGSFVIISTPNKDYLTKSSDSGEFSSIIKLEGGINQIKIFSLNNNQSEKLINVIHTTEIDVDSPQEKASLTSYTGTLTDIAEDTIQLRSKDGEIKQVTVKPSETSFANIIKTTKNITFSDVAIGDFVAALGTRNGNKILEAKRVLISTPPEQMAIKPVAGLVTDYTKNTITLDKEKIDTSDKPTVYTISEENETEKSSLKYIDKGSKLILIIVGEKNEDTVPIARTIFIIQ